MFTFSLNVPPSNGLESGPLITANQVNGSSNAVVVSGPIKSKRSNLSRSASFNSYQDVSKIGLTLESRINTSVIDVKERIYEKIWS